ncbi:chemotaxis protein [Pseudoalteromonas sp. XMcav1-K]|uniref:chemotaxis protein n=1 Tax=Pseudoalteromonas sp. XMcav1-K TaxID=3374372 RepID=UPI003756462B
MAQLEVILTEAKSLSLTSKNARVVAIRAGEAALGFKSITNFINEFSARTIQTTEHINLHASQLFRLALHHLRASQFEQHLAISLSLLDHPQSRALHHKAAGQVKDAMTALKHELQNLQWQFEEIEQQMRAAEYIAVTSRVEASQAGEFCASLESVSDYISSAAMRIKGAIETNLSTLDELERVFK